MRRGIATVRQCIQAAFFMSPRDIGLFLQSARTDATIASTRAAVDEQTAFDEAYAAGDPWASGDKRYLYQRHKYDVLAALLPSNRRFDHVLDIGAGLGLLARRIAERANQVVGLDISQEAVNSHRITFRCRVPRTAIRYRFDYPKSQIIRSTFAHYPPPMRLNHKLPHLAAEG